MLFRNVNLWESWESRNRDTSRECGRDNGHSQQDQSTGDAVPCEKAALPSQHPSTAQKGPSATKCQHSHCPAGHSYLVKGADKGHDEIHSFLCFFVYRQPAGICQRGRAGRAAGAVGTGESQGDLPSTQPCAHAPGTAFLLSSSWLNVVGRGAALLELGNMLGYGQERSKVPLLLTAHALEPLYSVFFLGEAVLGLASSPELPWQSDDLLPVPQDHCCHCARKTGSWHHAGRWWAPALPSPLLTKLQWLHRAFVVEELGF